jgi:light-regulated signal transduction histidine kinase (bacteriophytochrome)
VTRPDADAFVPLSPDEMKRTVMQFSHDVMSPLMSVHALSQVLLLEARPDQRLNEDLQRIHEAAEEALMLIRTLGVRIAAGRNSEDDPTGS